MISRYNTADPFAIADKLNVDWYFMPLGKYPLGDTSYDGREPIIILNDPIKYDEKFISITGTVIYIQKNPDDNNMYYVVIVPTDEYTTSGMSDGHGTVTAIDIDTMKAHPIHEGDTITVKGSGLTDTVTLNGKKLKSDIIVDYVKVH
jgi:hypothetical protein